MRPSINCDLGEGFAVYSVCDDAAMMGHIDVANVACGFHASDPVVMHRTVRLAKDNGVRVGAHPSYPDRQGWGRREMKIDREELRDLLVYQVGALKGFLDLHGLPLNHVKAHGALYGVATRDEGTAEALADVAEIFGVPLFGMAGTLHESVCRARGLGFTGELYADLNYGRDGRLLIQRQPPKVTPEQVVARCLRAIETGLVASADGGDVRVRFETICVHSDTPGAVAAAVALKKALGTVLA